jgi:DNA mismatch endonuclease (patch repair protein)
MLSLGGAIRVAYAEPSSASATAVMKGNRSRDTRPEVLLRSALHRRGLRFRKDYGLRVGSRLRRVDVAFTRRRLAVFVDGCFWHGCPDHGHTPRRNSAYWQAKLRRNTDRDRETTKALMASGWVLRIWEHEPLDVAVASVEAALDATG